MLAVRRGAVGALASGDARVRRACGAVRKGARAEAGWRRAPRARAEGFMGVRLRTFYRFPITTYELRDRLYRYTIYRSMYTVLCDSELVLYGISARYTVVTSLPAQCGALSYANLTGILAFFT